MISNKAEKLFIEAHALDPDTRVQFVTDACGDDAALRDEVNSLLAAANESENYFQKLSGKVGLNALAGDDVLPANTVFGQWRLLSLIGKGGMGSVYLAERADGQFEKQAALKILPIGLGGKQGHTRFLQERQILAQLNHDNIARLLDGGVTEDGVPYFVLDFVDGLPIDRYCETQRLSIADRLGLVLQIAETVQYAHRNLVIHRDLKPGNVLVEKNGQVRLLDFGIAKLLEPGAETEDLTRLSQRPATPGYASPEMLRGETVDATTDVYSLGVLTYQLLTGRHPILFDGLNLAEMHDRASKQIPPLASTHNNRVDGELDTIIAKTLAKTPEERYASIEAFAADIRSYMNGLPIAAKAPTTLYRVRKFIGRHRMGVSFAAFAATALIAITGLAIYSAVTSDRQAEAIALERDRAEEVRDFLVSVFTSADPNQAASDLTARELLDAGRQRVASDLADQPALQIELAKTIGNVYATIRMTNEWREMVEMELELRREMTGTDDIDYVDTLFGMSQLEDMSGNYDASQAHAEEALAITERLDHELGKAFAHMRLGRVLHLKGEYETAELNYRRALAINEAENGTRDVATNEVRMHLSTLLNHQQKYEEALASLNRVYEIRQEHYPGDHGEYSEVFLAMGSVLNALKRHDEAIEIYERAYAMNERLFGPDNRRNLFIVGGLGKVAEAMGDYGLAADRYEEAIRLTGAFFPGHPNLAIATSNLAKIHTLEDNFDLAIPLYRRALTIMEEEAPNHWALGDMRWRLGRCIVHTGGDFVEAESLILIGIERLTSQWGPEHRTTLSARSAAHELYVAWEKPDNAENYRPGTM